MAHRDGVPGPFLEELMVSHGHCHFPMVQINWEEK